MRPGDIVICTDATDHCWFLRVGETYTVETVRTSDGWVSLVGMARMWPGTQFRQLYHTTSPATPCDTEFFLKCGHDS